MIDARGYSCPTPVVMVQKAVKNGAPDTLEVAVELVEPAQLVVLVAEDILEVLLLEIHI